MKTSFFSTLFGLSYVENFDNFLSQKNPDFGNFVHFVYKKNVLYTFPRRARPLAAYTSSRGRASCPKLPIPKKEHPTDALLIDPAIGFAGRL